MKKKGFTLLELLVVIAIIGILSAVVMASLSSARAKARDARRISDVKQIATALNMVADDNGGNFPLTSGISKCLGLNGTCWGGGIAGDSNLNTAIQKFLPQIPKDPSGRSGKGDVYLYADANSTVAWHCTGTTSPVGPYIFWVADNITDTSQSMCKDVGFSACCGAGISCGEGYFCAYKIQ